VILEARHEIGRCGKDRTDRLGRTAAVIIHTSGEIDRQDDIAWHFTTTQCSCDRLGPRKDDAPLLSSRKLRHDAARRCECISIPIKDRCDDLNVALVLNERVEYSCIKARTAVRAA